MLEEQLAQARTFTREELAMQTKVNAFHRGLAERNHQTVQQSLNEVLGSIDPLNYWLPYKELTKLLIGRCTPEELASFSDGEVKYLVDSSAMLGDKEAPLGLHTVQEIYTKLEELKGDRNSRTVDGLRSRPMESSLLRDILIPSDIDSRIKEFRTRQYEKHDKKAEGKGFWTAWETLSDLSGQGLEHIIASGVNSELTSQYLETFMGENLYTNVFQCGDKDLLAHLTKVFELYFRQRQKEGMNVAEMPDFIERRMQEYIAKQGDVRAWKGVKEFTMMHISNEFAERGFLGANWRRYDPNQRCLDWIFEFADAGDFEKVAYVNGVAGFCCRGFEGLTTKLFHDSVLEFTRKYVRDGQIDADLGRKILLITSSIRTNADLRTQLSQPFTHKAVMDATQKGIPFAVGLHTFLYKEKSGIDNPMVSLIMGIAAERNKTPYLDHEAKESREHAEARLEQAGCFDGFDYTADAEATYLKAVREGRYISPINECNTSVEDIQRLGEEARTRIQGLRTQRKGTDYLYVRDGQFFMLTGSEQPRIFVGNPRNFGSFASLLGYWANSMSQYNPKKESPERHVVMEFEDKERRDDTNIKIREGLYGLVRGDYQFHFRLPKADTMRDERVLWELV
jgi:hypothetical protein